MRALHRRIDELREDLKASEARQREDLKDGLGKLDAKMDRLLEARFTQPVSPER